MGVIAVRNESVRVSLEDDFTSRMARMTAATALFKRELNGLDGKNVSRDLDGTSKSIDKVGTSSRKSAAEIDRMSGRWRLFADAAITIGPSLVSIGAASIPAITTALAGLGAAAGGISVAVLALHGLGDGLKAIDAYQLEPTSENLAKMRIELEKLGPAGAQFAQYIDGLGPQLKDLQNIARAGLFPGLEDGIDSMLTRLPQVRLIVAELASTMGDLASEAGQGIAGDKFTKFFDYIQSDAAPTLEAFARSTANLAEGFANLLVAFAPMTRDFTSGFEGMTEAFAKWSRGLDQNQGFQNFLNYIRDSGPQAIDLLGSIAEAFGGLIHAAAPFGHAVVPVLTALAKAFAAIADSPIGPPLYTAAAALILFNRASSVTQKSVTSLTTGFKSLSAEAESTQGRMKGLLGRGGIVLAGAAAVSVLTDSLNRIDTSKLDASLTALKFGDVTPTIDKVTSSIQNLESNWNKVDFGEIAHLGGLLGDTSLDKFAQNVDQVDKALAQMVESGNADQAATLFAKLQALAQAKGVDPSAVTKRFDDYAQAIHNVQEATYFATGATNPFSGALDVLSGKLRTTKQAATDLSGALAELNGWFDKRQAIRDYRDSIDDLAKSLKNGFKQKDAENLDAVGRNILQVANSIKDPGLQKDFLAGARASLVDMADHSGPKAAAAIQRVIDKFDSEGLTHPPKPKLEVEDKATPTLDQLDIHLRRTGNTTAKPKAVVDPVNSFSILDGIQSRLNNLHDKSITVRVSQVGGGGVKVAGGDLTKADGGTVPGPRYPYGDKMTILAAPGEEIISNRHGQADRFRADRAAGRIPGYADGGTVAPRQATWTGMQAHDASSAIQIWTSGVYTAAKALKALKDELDDAQKSLEKQKSKVDSITSAMSSLSSSVASRFDVNLGATSSTPWASGGGLQSMIDTATSQASAFPGIVAALKAAGLTGPALSQALQQMSFSQLQSLASNPGGAAQLGASLSTLYAAQQSAGGAAGDAVYGHDLRQADKQLAAIRDEVRELRKDVRQASKDNKRGHKDTADAAAGTHQSFSDGHRRGKRGPR